MFKAMCLRTWYLKIHYLMCVHTQEKKNLNLCFGLSVKVIKTSVLFVKKKKVCRKKKRQEINCYVKPESLLHQKTANCIKNYS